MTKILKGNIIFTKSQDEFTVVENGFIVVNEGKVELVSDTLPQRYSNYDILDYTNKLIIPGMNDLHCHAPQYKNIGMAMSYELLPWLDNFTFPEESKYINTDYALEMYKKFVKNIWKVGTTRSVVFSTIHTKSSQILFDLFLDSGLGSYIGKVNMDRNCNEQLKENTLLSLDETEKFIVENYNKSNLVKPIITPRFVPTCSEELLKGLGDLCLKYNISAQSHISENLNEIKWVKELHPNSKFYGDVYNEFNLFGQTPTLMAHCIHSSDEELNLMRKNNVFAVHCPASNLNLASGIMPLRKFLKNDINVGLGSDVGGGHDLSIFKAIVSSIQMSKLLWTFSNKEQSFLTLSEAFYIATKGGGSFFGKVGSFEVGYDFDALIIDDSNLNHSEYTLLDRLERFIYLGDDRHIEQRFVCGKLIEEPNF